MLRMEISSMMCHHSLTRAGPSPRPPVFKAPRTRGVGPLCVGEPTRVTGAAQLWPGTHSRIVRFLDVFIIHEFEIEKYWLLLSYFLYIAVQRRRTAPRLLAERTTTHKARFQLRSGPSRPASPRAVCAHRVCTLVCTQQTAWSRGTLSAVTLLAVLPNPNIHMRRLQHLSSRRRPRCY